MKNHLLWAYRLVSGIINLFHSVTMEVYYRNTNVGADKVYFPVEFVAIQTSSQEFSKDFNKGRATAANEWPPIEIDGLFA
jgi:hypothetical protein